MGCSRREGAGGAQECPSPLGENFPKQGLKQGLLVHYEQVVNSKGGLGICPLCTGLKFKHKSAIWTFRVCTHCNMQAVLRNRLKTMEIEH